VLEFRTQSLSVQAALARQELETLVTIQSLAQLLLLVAVLAARTGITLATVVRAVAVLTLHRHQRWRRALAQRIKVLLVVQVW
jgi:hypothetical protein